MLAQPASASFPGGNGKIAFHSTRDGNHEIYVMNDDGTGQTNLTNHPATDQGPAWSPDALKIAFHTTRDGNFEIYSMDASGGSLTNLTSDPATDIDADWSPDGTKIAFASDSDGDLEVYTMNAGGGGVTKLTNNSAEDRLPDWSPDGSKISFTTNRDGNFEIYAMNASGSGQTNLTNHPSSDAHNDWSPDGSKIAFTSTRDGSFSDIFVMNATGTGPVNLTSSGSVVDGFPAWSPDGTKIVFNAAAPAPPPFAEIVVMAASGGTQTNLTNDPSEDENPDWQSLAPYPRPKGATPMRIPLVPAYKACTAPSSTHGGPSLGGSGPDPSCSPPVPQSNVASIGVQSIGFVRITACVAPCPGVPAPDDRIEVSIKDVRAVAPTGFDYNPNPGGPDLTVTAQLRLTDRRNGGSGTDPGTVVDVPFPPIPVECAPTPEPPPSVSNTVGSTCTVDTSANALLPGVVVAGKRAMLQLTDVEVKDSGADGVRGNSDDQVFERVGIFNP